MDRKRMIALGAATIAVAALTGTAIQKLVPQNHPALAPQAGEQAAQPAPGAASGAAPGTAALSVTQAGLAPASSLVPQARPVGPDDEVSAAAGPALLPDPALTAELPAAQLMPLSAEVPAEVAEPLAEVAANLAEADQPAFALDFSLAEAVPAGLTDAFAAPLARAAEMLPRMAFMAADAPVTGASLPAEPEEPAESMAIPGGDDCAPRLVLAAAPAAMIDVAFDAPCNPGARAVIRHAGLALTGRTSGAGMLDVSLPAFAEAAEVTVAITGGPSISATVQVPDLADYDRVAVQWQNADAFQLHAFEMGAEFGAPGHVSAAAPSGPDAALRATGGFLVLLGDSTLDWPMLAEVYTFPAARMPGAGAVELMIEAAVTPATCGRELLGEALDVRRGGPLQRTEITLAMPGCDAGDGYVILNNVLAEMMLAQN